MQTCLQVFFTASLPVSKVFSVSVIIALKQKNYACIYIAKLYANIGWRDIVCRYWMQRHCLDADNLPCIQSISISCIFCSKAKMGAGIYAAKLNICIGYRTLLASIGCSIIPWNERVSSKCTYVFKQKCMQDEDMFYAK